MKKTKKGGRDERKKRNIIHLHDRLPIILYLCKEIFINNSNDYELAEKTMDGSCDDVADGVGYTMGTERAISTAL